MRVGVIADIHGNAPALAAVLQDARRTGGVDEWLCAGDFVGHLPLINECFEMLRSLPLSAVKGNHDDALLRGVPIERSVSATRALEAQRQFASAELLAYLEALPLRRELRLDGEDCLLLHGAPDDPLDGYLYRPSDSDASAVGQQALITGHTHHCMLTTIGRTTFLNPGSLGLPLDGRPGAAYALWDIPREEVSFRRVRYDPSPVLERLQELGFDARYPNCLRHGRWVGPNAPGREE